MARIITGTARALLRGTMLERVEPGATRQRTRTSRLNRPRVNGRGDSTLLPPIVR